VSPLPAPRPDLPPIEVYGFTSVPNLNRSNRSHIVLFVNGRAISDQSLTYAVVQAYRTLIPQGRYPLAVLLIELEPGEVDVNVHPTKAEVRFRVPDAVFSAVQRAVRRAVVDQAPVPGIGMGEGAERSGWGERWAEDDHEAPARPVAPVDGQLRLDLESSDPGRYGQQRAFGPAEADHADNLAYVTSDADDSTAIPAGLGAPKRPRTLPILRVIGQVGAMYIVAEGPAGMYLIDQHAAHERILYEQFMATQAAMKPVAQHTLPVTTLEFAPGEAQLVEDALDVLAGLGRPTMLHLSGEDLARQFGRT
jgi:DNA mismatch repair protein MutL